MKRCPHSHTLYKQSINGVEHTHAPTEHQRNDNIHLRPTVPHEWQLQKRGPGLLDLVYIDIYIDIISLYFIWAIYGSFSVCLVYVLCSLNLVFISMVDCIMFYVI